MSRRTIQLEVFKYVLMEGDPLKCVTHRRLYKNTSAYMDCIKSEWIIKCHTHTHKHKERVLQCMCCTCNSSRPLSIILLFWLLWLTVVHVLLDQRSCRKPFAYENLAQLCIHHKFWPPLRDEWRVNDDGFMGGGIAINICALICL